MRKFLLFAVITITTSINAQINVTYQNNNATYVKPIENFDVNISDYKSAHELLGLIGNKLFAFPLNKNYDYSYSKFSIKLLTKKNKKDEYKIVNKEIYENLLAGKYVEVDDVVFGGIKNTSPEEWEQKNKFRSSTPLHEVEIYATEKTTGNKFIINAGEIKYFVAEKYFENMKNKYLNKQLLNNKSFKYKKQNKSYEDIYSAAHSQPKPIEKEDIVKIVSIDFSFKSLSYPSLTVKFDNTNELELDGFLFKNDYIDLEEYKRFYESYSIYKEQRIEEEKLAQIQEEEEYKKKEEEWRKKIEKEQAEKYTRLTKTYGKAIADDMMKKNVRIGWTKQMCIESWGKPKDINKTTTQYSVREQWVYGNGNYLYFENGKLTTIQN